MNWYNYTMIELTFTLPLHYVLKTIDPFNSAAVTKCRSMASNVERYLAGLPIGF